MTFVNPWTVSRDSHFFNKTHKRRA